MPTNRDKAIDLLRFIGLSLIILAHISPPSWLFQLRNFDVPLMVLVSGITYSIQPKKQQYFNYVAKRVKRLLYPAWTFLTIYFLCTLIFDLRFDKLTFVNIFHSYTFISGIGFVWIFRVFLITSLFAPLIDKFNIKLPCNNRYLIFLLCSFIAYEIVLQFGWKEMLGERLYLYFNSLILSGIFYTLIFSLGTRLLSFSRLQITYLLSCATIMFIGYAMYYFNTTGRVQATQNFKYPPQLYYLSYSLILTTLCYVLSPAAYKLIAPWRNLNTLLVFISRNTLWIYFYHIIFIKMRVAEYFPNLFISYIIVYAASLLCCFLQLSIVFRLIPLIKGNATKDNLRFMFTG
jgi:fucose 4-O-acetylase-like acetyltransferase